ncbi:hypothetical protein M409DRAFT_63781 [Zasmidium cellare ATCC 36951]|uniref:Major facilitator superfamily (MFS) profile domain-containing protein n=1 Tax=Zasmidium cellare ATCC 36951 TaxID=1080233 RepID=A0A6A6CZD3_ZASCE|nr:uncharacterized protein M409DRAFT_63781 [Zasmidium cellare ATCC 36951]KAF2171560.1 hypothetical protein M409DRAFT_63781 [Zasmidium cellare ATCC 36951]
MAKTHLISTARQAIKESPKEIFNWYLFFCCAIISFSGVAKGTASNIASIVVMPAFKERFHIAHQSEAEYADTKGWIVSIATAGAVFGCLSCTWCNSHFGRKITLQIYTVIYIAGIFGQTFSGGSLAALYVSRIISGFGIGGTTIVPSVYLAEIAPKSIRGLITIQYASCQQLGVVFGFFFNYGITKSFAGTQTQWQLPTALQIVPAVIWGVGTFFVAESPRWLLSVNKRSDAIRSLERIRHLPREHPLLVGELGAMDVQLENEIESVAGASQLDLLKETLATPENRRRFSLMFLAHTFGQWSGANAITQYSPTIFGYLGVASGDTTFLATGLYGVVKFASVLIFSVFVVDFVGRRRSLLTGIILQTATLIFIAGYLGATTGMTAAEIEDDGNLVRASTAAIVAIYLHAVAWSIGWFSLPYLINSEIFPTRIRSFNVSIFMALHWAYYFGCSRAMPSLLAATDRYGAFIFFASICALSLVFAFLCMPETAGRSLESLDLLFERPLHTVWKVAYPSTEDVIDDAIVGQKALEADDAFHVEIRY